MILMTRQAFQQYKFYHNTIPRCIALGCHVPILVGDQCERMRGLRNTKYLCGSCSKKEIVVYLKPMPRRNKVQGIEKFSSESDMIRESFKNV